VPPELVSLCRDSFWRHRSARLHRGVRRQVTDDQRARAGRASSVRGQGPASRCEYDPAICAARFPPDSRHRQISALHSSAGPRAPAVFNTHLPPVSHGPQADSGRESVDMFFVCFLVLLFFFCHGHFPTSGGLKPGEWAVPVTSGNRQPVRDRCHDTPGDCQTY